MKSLNKDILISNKEWLILIIFSLVGVYINDIAYKSSLSIIFQITILSLTFILFRNRPSMFLITYIFFSVLPSKLYGGFFVQKGSSYYALNSRISFIFLIIFILYDLIVKRKSFKLSFAPILLFIFAIFSSVTTVSYQNYDFEFWWKLIGYISFPFLIRDDKDLKLILVSFVLSVFTFCIKVLPVILNGDLYRGWINLDPNYATFYILTGFVSLVTLVSIYKEISIVIKVFFLLCTFLFIYTMTFFSSRTGFFAVIIIILLFSYFNRKQLKLVFLYLFFLLVYLFIIYESGSLSSLLLRFFDANTFSAGGRLSIQLELLRFFKGSTFFRLIFGYGYLTSNNFGLKLQAHNTYISILIGFGIIGVTFYLMYLSRIFVNLIKVSKNKYLLIFWFLVFYGLSLEPYQIIEGIILFSILSSRINYESKQVEG